MKFSIIIPFYNAEKYFEQCLQNLVEQNYPKSEFEIIAVDDCSNDNSSTIVQRLIERYSNIRLITHNINKRQGGARNTGILEARGEWILFVDSDDCWISKNVLREFNSVLEKYSELQVIKSISYSTSPIVYPKLKIYQEMSGIDYLCSDNYRVTIWDGCYKREFILENNLLFRENAFFEDSDWSLLITLKARKLLLIDYPFYLYRTNLESTTNGHSLSSYRDNITSSFIIEQIINENYLPDNANNKCRMFILGSIMIFVKTSRHYSNDFAIEQLSRLQQGDILNQDHYRLSYIQKSIFYLLKNNVNLLVRLIKIGTKIKHILRMYRKSTND